LREIPLKTDPAAIPTVSLIGEYFVRKDDFSRMNIIDYLQASGIMVKVAPAAEYMGYSNRNFNKGIQEGDFTPRQRVVGRLRSYIQDWWERRIKTILAQSGLCHFELMDVEKTIQSASHLMSEHFRGECILTVGSALREILDSSSGIVALGPFGCMPSRMAEAILKKEMNAVGKSRMHEADRKSLALVNDFGEFPFLSIETDGNPFPQIVEARLEAFVLQVRRLHEKLATADRQMVTNPVGLIRSALSGMTASLAKSFI